MSVYRECGAKMSNHEVRAQRSVDSAILLSYSRIGDSGLDLRGVEKTLIPVGNRRVVRTGIVVQITERLEAQVRSRSGLAKDHGINVFNSPGQSIRATAEKF